MMMLWNQMWRSTPQSTPIFSQPLVAPNGAPPPTHSFAVPNSQNLQIPKSTNPRTESIRSLRVIADSIDWQNSKANPLCTRVPHRKPWVFDVAMMCLFLKETIGGLFPLVITFLFGLWELLAEFSCCCGACWALRECLRSGSLY
jgi:hypothetical protein